MDGHARPVRAAKATHRHPDWRQMDAECAGETNHEKGSAKPHGKKQPSESEEPKARYLALPPMARAFLNKLKRAQLLSSDAETAFLEENSDHLNSFKKTEAVGRALVAGGYLTEYQLDRVLAGKLHGMIFGNHRVVGRLGAGGMGVVFRAEHIFMKRQVAVKVLPVDDDCPPEILARFCSEMQVLAGLHHPNIVAAFDSGFVPAPARGEPALFYLVMELLEGGDLEQIVCEHGPLAIGNACEWIAQAARGLQEAHDRHLIHRDIKPSNMLIGENLQVKLVDFGLVQQFNLRQTDMGTLLGTIEYMAPEQSVDASSVGAAADIFGLGATLFWALTGESPHPKFRSISQALKQIREVPARRLRDLRPDAPVELERLLQSMLDRDPLRRPTVPMTVSRTLEAFCH